MPAERNNTVTSVVLCAQGHAGAVTRFMVGFAVASYTCIIEQGLEQQQGATPMTTNQNDTNLLTDAHLDIVAAGSGYVKLDGDPIPHGTRSAEPLPSSTPRRIINPTLIILPWYRPRR